MTVTFDENVQERDCVVLFKFNSEFNVCVTVIEMSCCVFTVKQAEGIVNLPKPNRRASVVVTPLLPKSDLQILLCRSNARRFYSSKGDLLGIKGLKNPFLLKLALKDIGQDRT